MSRKIKNLIQQEKQIPTQINITKNISDTKNMWKSGKVYKKEEKKKVCFAL